MGGAEPNDGHRALTRLEADGRVSFLITQNVDGLHERAGQRRMVALHGRVSDVVCLDCGARTHRDGDAAPAGRGQPGLARASTPTSPPGPTATSTLEETAGFVVPACAGCGGRLKPHVVFFGENVPKDRVERCYAAVDDADALLVAGSSLTVMSGLRFVRYAAKAGLPVVIVNRGVDPRRRPGHGQGRGRVQRVARRVGDWPRRRAASGGRDEDVLGRLGDDLGRLA